MSASMQLTGKRRVRAGSSGPSIRCGIKDSLMPVVVSATFAYEQTLDPEALASALPLALREYPFFAGTLRNVGNHQRLECDDSGALFEIARHERPFETEVADRTPGPYLAKIAGGFDRPGPLLSVRVNQFRGGGTLIGGSWHHSAGDARTFTSFMKAWSDIAAGKAIDPPLIALDRGAFMLEHTVDNHVPSEQRLLGLRELVKLAPTLAQFALRSRQLRLEFSEEQLAEMHHALQQRTDVALSRNDALMGHLVAALDQADPRSTQRPLLLAVNWRQRRGLGPTVAGNLSSMMTSECAPGARPEQIAAQLRRAIVDWGPNYHSLRRFYEQAGGFSNAYRMIPSGVDPLRGSLAISNLDRLGFYDVPFAGRAPSMVNVYLPALPWFGGVVEGAGNRGRLLRLSLPAAIAERLQRSPLLRVAPQLRPTGHAAVGVLS